MGDVFPELKRHEVRIRDTIAEEEVSFGKTLLKGNEKFEKAAHDVQGKLLSGQLMADDNGLQVDVEGFNNAMNEVDYDRRKLIAANHTYTHMLNFALRKEVNMVTVTVSTALFEEYLAMVFSTDETTNKVVVCAGVPEKEENSKQLEVSEWLKPVLGPVKGRCGIGKEGLASGQGTDASHVHEALALAESFASMELR